MRKSFSYWLVLLVLLLTGSVVYAQLSYTPPSFAPKQVIPSATFNTLFNTIDQEALNRTGGVVTGNITFSPDNTVDLGASGATRPRDFFLGRNAAIGGTLSVSGATTLASMGATTGTFSSTLNVTGATTLSNTLAVAGATTLSSTLGVTGAATFTSTAAINSTTASALDVAGGIQAGSGNVAIVGTDGRIPAISSTTFASLSGANLTGLLEANIAEGSVFPRLAAPETISGAYTFTADVRLNAAVPSIRITENDQATDAKQWQLASSGSVFSLFAINDAESAGSEAFTISRSTTTPVLTTIKTALALDKTRDVTTADGEQTIALNSNDYLLRVSTAGTATADKIIGFSGGVAGRTIIACMVTADTSGGELVIRVNDASATAGNQVLLYSGATAELDLNVSGACKEFLYDGTSGWRLITR